jgi:hypothetical protein
MKAKLAIEARMHQEPEKRLEIPVGKMSGQ